MRIICCTGDSHTWGQGVPGIDNFIAGDLRPLGFSLPYYVNLLRNKLSTDFKEYSASVLANGSELDDGCASVKAERPLVLPTCGLLYRIVFRGMCSRSAVSLELDGKVVLERELTVQSDHNAYIVVPFFAENDGEHTLTVRALEGSVRLYRLESYSGDTAVINCGIGSCPSFRFLGEYWQSYVAACRPDVVVMESHSINDWLTEHTPEESEECLVKMVDEVRALGAEPILVSSSPILGNQKATLGIDYIKYIEAVSKAASRTGCRFADAYAAMESQIRGLSEKESRTLMFADVWHPNELGHSIYANEILKALGE